MRLAHVVFKFSLQVEGCMRLVHRVRPLQPHVQVKLKGLGLQALSDLLGPVNQSLAVSHARSHLVYKCPVTANKMPGQALTVDST